MTVRFQADADFSWKIVEGILRIEPSIDFQSADEMGIRGLTDPEILRLCADEGRILVTSDRRTMPLHFGEFISRRKSPGVLIVPQRMQIQRAIEDLILIWAVSEAEEWRNVIYSLPV